MIAATSVQIGILLLNVWEFLVMDDCLRVEIYLSIDILILTFEDLVPETTGY